jgi:hypothetical protein
MTHQQLLQMKAEGNTWVTVEGREFRWPFCRVDGCTSRACLRLMSLYCWPHTDVGKLSMSLESSEPLAEFALQEADEHG